MPTARKYKLLKSLLNFKENEVLTSENEHPEYFNADGHSWYERIHHLTIETNPDWFQLIPEASQSKEWEWTDESAEALLIYADRYSFGEAYFPKDMVEGFKKYYQSRPKYVPNPELEKLFAEQSSIPDKNVWEFKGKQGEVYSALNAMPNTKERIEISRISLTWVNGKEQLSFTSNRFIKTEKWGLIREAIERAMNDEPTYSKSCVDILMADAFNAAREMVTPSFGLYKYPTFESYLETLKEKHND